jgi:hypothetical protein
MTRKSGGEPGELAELKPFWIRPAKAGTTNALGIPRDRLKPGQRTNDSIQVP